MATGVQAQPWEMYFDTSLQKPVWYTGTIWVDRFGSPV
jgi:hypothetical protein